MPDLKFLVDANCGRSFFNYLKDNGFNATFANEIKLGMTDEEIISIAKDEDRIIITMDSDFGTLIYRDLYEHSGVLFLRLDSNSIEVKARVFNWIILSHGHELKN